MIQCNFSSSRVSTQPAVVIHPPEEVAHTHKYMHAHAHAHTALHWPKARHLHTLGRRGRRQQLSGSTDSWTHSVLGQTPLAAGILNVLGNPPWASLGFKHSTVHPALLKIEDSETKPINITEVLIIAKCNEPFCEKLLYIEAMTILCLS